MMCIHNVNNCFPSVNTTSRPPTSLKICLLGSDGFVNSVLRPYVEIFSTRTPDFLNLVRFLVVPLGKFPLIFFLY